MKVFTPGNRVAPILIIFSFALTTGKMIFEIFNQNRAQNPGAFADWLINYSGGFVRRGLSGAILMELHTATGVSIEDLTWLAQSSITCAFMGVIAFRVAKLWKSKFEFWLLLFLPVGCFYQLSTPGVLGRKEILLYLVLILALWASKYPVKSLQFATFLSSIACALMMHEGLVFYFGYFVIIFWLKKTSVSEFKWRTLSTAVVSAVFLILMLANSSASGKQICENLIQQGGLGSGVCSVSTVWLEYSITEAIGQVIFRINRFDYFEAYVPAAVITIASFAFYLLSVGVRMTSIAALAVLTWVPTLVLFLIATDWGRWISMHAISGFILVIFLTKPRETSSKHPLVSFFGNALFGIMFFLLWWVNYVTGNFKWLPIKKTIYTIIS